MATINLDKAARSLLRKEMNTYMQNIGDMTVDEKNDLYEWVASGNSVYDNPFCYSDERGNPLDYLSTMRVVKDQLEEISLLQTPPPVEEEWDEEINTLF